MTDTVPAAATASEQALEQYAPEPSSRRRGIGLCLSGGGYRATLFHLGALRRLNELGILGRLRTIASVSGGSITAAHLATAVPWPLSGTLPDWEERVAKPLRAFTRRNIRTGPLVARLLPWNWLGKSTAVVQLARRYRKHLTSLTLGELPETPNFVFCATDMAFGVNWVFERVRMGDYQAGYVSPHPADFPVATAVGASSCFPPIFDPLPMRYADREYRGGACPRGPERTRALKDLRLTDGGNYDNLGLEPVWKNHEIVLSSDGGGTFDFGPDESFLWRLGRYTTILENQARALRKRWLISSFISGVMSGTYWGIGSARSSYDQSDAGGYSKEFAQKVIAEIRTDLDAFSEAEAAVLENHGYLLADAAVRRHVPRLVTSPPPPLAVPHDGWLDERAARHGLRGSQKRKNLGRR